MDQCLGLDSCDSIESRQNKKLISQKENIMTHFCNMDFLVVNNDGVGKPLCLIGI